MTKGANMSYFVWNYCEKGDKSRKKVKFALYVGQSEESDTA